MEKQRLEQFIDCSSDGNTNYAPIKAVLDGRVVFNARLGTLVHCAVHDIATKRRSRLTTKVYVEMDEAGQKKRAYREDCIIVPEEGNEESNTIPFTTYDIGNRVKGTFDMETNTFAEDDSPLCQDSFFDMAEWKYEEEILYPENFVYLLNEGKLATPSFHREYIWSKEEASRFIESVLYGMPMQSIFITDGKKRFIIDGYQRIMTICSYFRDGSTFRLSNSEKINFIWRNKKFSDLSEDEKIRARATEFHTIILHESGNREYDDFRFRQIFERINTCNRI